jgi:lactoylglutathione lyase
MKITKPGIILFAKNYERCVIFYRDLLGFELMFKTPSLSCLEFGGAYLMVETGGVEKKGGKTRAENPTTIRLNVEDVEAAAQELRAQGVNVSISEHSWGTIGTFNDPDGNKCQLKDAMNFDLQCYKDG